VITIRKMVKPKVKNETKQEKFKRLAEQRTQRVLRDLRILGNCANRVVYEYSDEQVRKIFSTIEDEVKRIKLLFSSKPKKRDFSLD